MTIWAHTLVKNEDRFVWFAIQSVINHVDRVLVYDTGSCDRTVEIIKLIKKEYPKKISFKQVGEVDISEFTQIRQEMLEKTKSDWFLVVDGDEIWWDGSIKKVAKVISRSKNKFESVVVPNILSVGDIFHKLPEKAGMYRLAGREGHLALRGIRRNIPGLASNKPHGTWGWVDENGKMIQERKKSKIVYVNAPYLHTTFLRRSQRWEDDRKVPKRKQKKKYEIGVSLPKDFYYPEVLFREKPDIVPDIWERAGIAYKTIALAQTPLKRFKRKVWFGKVGY